MGTGLNIRNLGHDATHMLWAKQNRAKMKELFFQSEVDGAIPMTHVVKEYDDTTRMQTWQATALLRGWADFRLRNYLINFKSGQAGGVSARPHDDLTSERTNPTGMATIKQITSWMLLLAPKCSANAMDINAQNLAAVFNSTMKIWALDCSIINRPCYLCSSTQVYGLFMATIGIMTSCEVFSQRGILKVVSVGRNDVEKRFIRSLLRVRHTTKYAAQMDLLTILPGGTYKQY